MPPPLPPPGMGGMSMPGMPPGMGRGMPGMAGNRPTMMPPQPSSASNPFGPPPGRGGGGMMPPFGSLPGEGRGRGPLGGPQLGGPFNPDRPGPLLGRSGGMPPPGMGRAGPPMSRNGPISPPPFNTSLGMDRPERSERPPFGGPPPSERPGFGGPLAWKPPMDQVDMPAIFQIEPTDWRCIREDRARLSSHLLSGAAVDPSAVERQARMSAAVLAAAARKCPDHRLAQPSGALAGRRQSARRHNRLQSALLRGKGAAVRTAAFSFRGLGATNM